MSKQTRKNIHRLIKTATREIPINQQFVFDLDAAITKLDDLNSYEPSQTYKPSSMICVRNMYYQVIGEKRDIESKSAQLIGMAQTGSARHDSLQEVISKMRDFNIDCEYIDVEEFIKKQGIKDLIIKGKSGYETKLYHTKLNISFLCDGIIRYKGEYYILEIKTETIYKWQTRRNVAEEHIPQGTAYSICFGLDKVLFLYENRDNCGKKAYILEITDKMRYELVISKIEESDKHIKLMTPPPKPANMTEKGCQYCRYKTACRRAGN